MPYLSFRPNFFISCRYPDWATGPCVIKKRASLRIFLRKIFISMLSIYRIMIIKIKNPELNLFVQKLKKNRQITGIILFGSSLNSSAPRDIDICLFTVRPFSLKAKLRLLRNLPEHYDINFYDDLSINLKKEILSAGKVLFTKDYYLLLKELMFINDESVRYQRFLEDYHQQRMASI